MDWQLVLLGLIAFLLFLIERQLDRMFNQTHRNLKEVMGNQDDLKKLVDWLVHEEIHTLKNELLEEVKKTNSNLSSLRTGQEDICSEVKEIRWALPD
jgi:hypothetical protein